MPDPKQESIWQPLLLMQKSGEPVDMEKNHRPFKEGGPNM